MVPTRHTFLTYLVDRVHWQVLGQDVNRRVFSRSPVEAGPGQMPTITDCLQRYINVAMVLIVAENVSGSENVVLPAPAEARLFALRAITQPSPRADERKEERKPETRHTIDHAIRSLLLFFFCM